MRARCHGDDRERARVRLLLDLVELLLELRPERVELALRLGARLRLGRPEGCEAVDELVGGPLDVCGGRLDGLLVERERVGGQRCDRRLDARDPRAQLAADTSGPLLAGARFVVAAAPAERGGRECDDDGEQTEMTGGHPGILRAPGVPRKRGSADPCEGFVHPR